MNDFAKDLHNIPNITFRTWNTPSFPTPLFLNPNCTLDKVHLEALSFGGPRMCWVAFM
jgi:hypothetical protein